MNLKIQFWRKPDFSNVFKCIREDGTETWQRRHGEFFVYHDLHHLAVESVLGLTSGFYGLVILGWNITDFGTPWPRGPIPSEHSTEALYAETLAALLDHEFQSGHRPDVVEFNDQLRASWDGYKERESHGRVREVCSADLDQIRTHVDLLHRAWIETAEEDILSLQYPLSAN